jgi:hypothetical protein
LRIACTACEGWESPIRHNSKGPKLGDIDTFHGALDEVMSFHFVVVKDVDFSMKLKIRTYCSDSCQRLNGNRVHKLTVVRLELFDTGKNDVSVSITS